MVGFLILGDAMIKSGKIMVEMKSAAIMQNKPFDEGVFFDLIFMSDKELLRISKLCGIK